MGNGTAKALRAFGLWILICGITGSLVIAFFTAGYSDNWGLVFGGIIGSALIGGLFLGMAEIVRLLARTVALLEDMQGETDDEDDDDGHFTLPPRP